VGLEPTTYGLTVRTAPTGEKTRRCASLFRHLLVQEGRGAVLRASQRERLSPPGANRREEPNDLDFLGGKAFGGRVPAGEPLPKLHRRAPFLPQLVGPLGPSSPRLAEP